MSNAKQKGAIGLVLTSIAGGIIAFTTQHAAPTAIEISGTILKTSIQQMGVEYVKKTLNHSLSSIFGDDEKAKEAAAEALAKQYAESETAPINITLKCAPDASAEDCIRENQEEFYRQAGLEKLRQRMIAMEETYEICRQETVQNPDIDATDILTVYPANIQCLSDKGFATELTVLSHHDPDLKDILDNIR